MVPWARAEVGLRFLTVRFGRGMLSFVHLSMVARRGRLVGERPAYDRFPAQITNTDSASPQRIKMNRLTVLASLFLPILLPTALFAGSETPPPGPPWKRDFYDAQQEALRGGKPIFIYFTKTY